VDVKALIMGIAFAAMWSSAFTSARIAVMDAPPFLFLTARFLLSGGLAIILAYSAGQRIELDRKGWTAVILFGALQNAVYLGFNFVAAQWLEASLSVVVASILPLIVAALAFMFLGERLSALAVAGLVAGLSGAVLIMGARLGGGADPLGLVLVIVAVVALASATILVRGFSAGGNLLMIVGLQMMVGCALMFPASLVLETWDVTWTWRLVAAFLYTTLVPGLFATWVWFRLVTRIGATRAAAFHFLNPFLGVAVAAALLNERVTGRDLFGVAIIMAGILAVQAARQRGADAKVKAAE
jgi:drug/metabolite transporter (DMT)-like permease